MCGIAGYFGPGELDAQRVLASLGHRGPNGAGHWATALPHRTRLQLLHTRLSILDLSDAGAQPMGLRRPGGEMETGSAFAAGDDVRQWRVAGPAELAAVADPISHFGGPGANTASAAVVLSFNGEIYNYRELRAELAALGHSFRSTGDSEVLLRGYAHWGAEVFAKLDGMFALAIYDAAQRRLVVARDHVGIKPLYTLRATDGGFAFASEVRTLVRSGLWHGEVDREGVADFLRTGSLQEPRTLWSGIRAFPAGHWGYVRLDEGAPAALQLRPYWLPERIDLTHEAETTWRARHASVLGRTVEEQLASDVPLGVYLSGGIDSTLLMEQAAAHGGRARVTAFTLGGAATEQDEARIASGTAQHAGVRHVVVALEQRDLESWVRDGLAAMDQPSSDGINTYLVSRASRAAGLVVALGGTGADELHGAYGHARSLARLLRGWRASGPLRGLAARAAVAGLSARRGAVAGERLRELLQVAPSPWRMAFERRRFFTTTQARALWPAGQGIEPRLLPPFHDEEAYLGRAVEDQVRLAELRGYLLNTLLRDADWATMANQQELRVPYLGRRYMETVLSAPEVNTEPRGGVKKPLLTGLLSAESRRLTNQPKRGFLLNYVALLLGPLRGEFGAASEALNAQLGFALRPAELLAELERSRDGKFSRRLWALLALGKAVAGSEERGAGS